jgi:cyclopropane fatty-acyl-phospholipid synthase-like methyltransferase
VIVDRVRRSGGRRVLEIGCGSGQLAVYLLDMGVEEYIGLDFSPVAIDMARSKVPRGQFIVGDARTSSIYTDFKYDIIISTEVLEHIEDDFGVVARFPPGTRCLCTVPNFEYESHVRHFLSSAEVAARYSSFFNDFDVVEFKGTQSTETYFLFDGVRNDRRA